MTLIKSISGIRGTIGGQPGEGLSPVDVVKYTAAYAEWVKLQHPGQTITVVVGRDARISGANGSVVGGWLRSRAWVVWWSIWEWQLHQLPKLL